MMVLIILKGALNVNLYHIIDLFLFPLLFFPFFKGDFTLYLSNAYFFLSAIFLLASFIGFVLKAGTFDLFVVNWKKFGSIFRPNLPNEEEEKDVRLLSERIGQVWFKTALKIGLIFFIASLFFLLFYYLL